MRRQLVASGIVHSAKRLSPQLIDQIYQYVQKPRSKAFTSWQQSEFTWNGLRTSLGEKLHEITVPTLIIHGENDRAVPLAHAQQLISNSQIYILKGCGHWPQRERPEEFHRVVRDCWTHEKEVCLWHYDLVCLFPRDGAWTWWASPTQ